MGCNPQFRLMPSTKLVLKKSSRHHSLETGKKRTRSWSRSHPYDKEILLIAANVRACLQLGQLSAAGGAATIGASLDIDDVAGEADQDRGKGRAPFPEDRLSDGGSGGAVRVVSDDFGTDWTAEITSSSNRMRKSGRNHMKIARKIFICTRSATACDWDFPQKASCPTGSSSRSKRQAQ